MPARQATLDAERSEKESMRRERDDAREDANDLRDLSVRQAQKITDVQAALLETHNDREALRERVADLEQQIADRDITLRGVVEERGAALAALERLSDAPLWTPATEKNPLQLARDERDARRALTERLELLQAASERRDVPRNNSPWTARPEVTS